jgi:hypothetical protein
MNTEEIQKFLGSRQVPEGHQLKIDFKKRDTIYGWLVQSNDYNDLKSKNLWRIVRQKDMEEWSKTENVELAKIFNGSDFMKLSVVPISE